MMILMTITEDYDDDFGDDYDDEKPSERKNLLEGIPRKIQ